MQIRWDASGDFLEVRFGKVTPSYYEDLGDDVFERHDETTGEIKGYAFFNVQKRKQKSLQDIEVSMPSVSVTS